VPVVLVALQHEGRQLGQHVLGQSGVDQQPQTVDGPAGAQQLGQLVADPLCRHDVEPVAHRRHRRDDLRVRGEAQLGDESGRAHHPQRVVTERDAGRNRCADHPGRQVVETTELVDELAGRQPHGHGVDREVAAREVAVE
jgi:hypothetical protein